MKKQLLFTVSIIFLLSSCAFNKLFLHPYPLTTSDQFDIALKEMDDSLTLRFNEDKSPEIYNRLQQPMNEIPFHLESILFENRNGDTLNAWLIEPREQSNGTLLYFLHGNAGNIVFNSGLALPFVEKGYRVFILDYSGFGFSQGKPTRKNVLSDANDGLKFIVNRLNYTHLLIYGQSLGGHLAAVVGAQNQADIDGIILEGAFSSHSDIAANRVPILGRVFTREIYSGKKHIRKYTKPVLIIHSTEDETVPFELGEKLYEAANKPKEFYSIEKKHVRGPIHYADSIVAKMKRMTVPQH